MSYIIYGYNDNNILDVLPTKKMVVLIEPRGLYIDKFRNDIKKYPNLVNVKLIAKALSDSDKLTECILSFNKEKGIYYIDTQNRVDCQRERIHTTSLQNIINEYDIQDIEKLFLNLNVDNINNLLNATRPYNHIISNISFKSCVDREKYETNSILELFKRQDKISEDKFSDWVNYSHKNLGIELPKICMFFTKSDIVNKSLMLQFIKKYKIDLVINNKVYEFTEIEDHIPNINIDNSIFFTKNLLNNLDFIFKLEKRYDIIMAFNQTILARYPNFYILFPPNDDTLYINREYDVIYSSKNGMYMLYQILYSNYFNEWIHEQAKTKPTLVKFFIKKWMYEYIAKSFKIKNIP